MTNDVVKDLRWVYVELRDAADAMRSQGTEFAMGVANGYDLAADAIDVLLIRSTNE